MTTIFKLDQFLVLVISKTDKTILFVIFSCWEDHIFYGFGCLCAERQCYLILQIY